MSSTDDNIELIELNTVSTKSYLKSKLRKNDNKVGSPSTLSPVHSELNDDRSNFSLTKSHSSQLPPPKPPRIYRHKLSKTIREVTLPSQNTSDDLKERHFDEFSESAISSKSDNRSYREKFRERFESVKKQAGKSVSKAHTTHKFKNKSETIRNLKRSVNLMKLENEKIDKELHNYENHKLIDNTEKTYFSNTEAYRFFCEDNKLELEENESLENKTEVEGANFEKSTEVLITISENEEKDTKAAIYFLPATSSKFNIRISENELFWRPTRKKLSITEKLETSEPRFLAEEGFFVDRKPKISRWYLNTLEQRLFLGHDKKWFNCEGKLEMLTNPNNYTSYRPHLYKEENSVLHTHYISATMGEIERENLSVQNENILNISIMAINFKHHPLFSLEHVFEQKLISLYDSYKQNISINKLERLSKRLDALRRAKKNIETSFDNNNKEANEKKLNKYSDEIKNLRKLYFEEGKQLRQLIKSILHAWKIIKHIRQNNKYSNTAIKLSIIKEKCNHADEIEIWETKIEETYNEITSELEKKYYKDLAEYKAALEEWKREKTTQNNIKKPKRPLKNIDSGVIREEIVENFKESFREPGEPILHFNLSYDNEITEKIENSKEKLRRNVVAMTKIYLRIVCSKMEVCKSKTVFLSDKFTCFVNESFSILFSKVPDTIVIEVHEQPNTLMKRKLGEIFINVPSKNNVRDSDKILEEYFEKSEIVHYKHEGVGSGIELKNNIHGIENYYLENLNTSGTLTYKIDWDTKNLNRFGQESTEHNVVKNILGENGTIDISKLTEWIKENNPDPQDPKYSVLYEYIKNYEDYSTFSTYLSKSYFRYNSDMDPLMFCKTKDIENNLRFQILELRDRNEPEFVGMVIPNRVKEIPTNILDDYKYRIEKSGASLKDEEEDDYVEDEIDSKRLYGRKYLKQVYTKIFQQCRNTQSNLVYEDVVNEKIIPRIEFIVRNTISNILNWVQFQPTINVKQTLTKHVPSTQMDLNNQVKIIVTVKSAMNVPLRNIDKTPQSLKLNTVHPFAVVTYQNVSLQTTSREGANPIWNEKLVLPVETKNVDYLSPNSLSGSIVLRLFDEIIVKARHGHVKTKNWLGSIEIPISAIAYNNKMEGLFKIRKPAHLFGYESKFDIDSSARINITAPDESKATYLSLMIILEPNVPKLTHSMIELESNELPYLKQYILNWNEIYNNSHPNRKFSALALDINGKTSCITRYIKCLEPPQLNSDSFGVSVEQCARFVSMIPFTDSNKFYQNVWLTTEQLLKLMIGSVVDHAIALTCYLTSLQLETWLILGYGLPHGTTAYVLIREYIREAQTPKHYIYDVITATRYEIMDTICPLQTIYCVINENNVWANVQRTDQIQLTRFDLNRRTDWLPLFTQQVMAPTNSIQQKLNYLFTPDIQQLEIKIDKKIRKKISKLRKQERTVWNHYLSRLLKNGIIKFETGILQIRHISDIFPDIHNYFATHAVDGFLINMPYTTISSIIATVMSSGIHLNEGLNTEFCLAVQIYPYPNQVLSTWICLAAMTPR